MYSMTKYEMYRAKQSLAIECNVSHIHNVKFQRILMHFYFATSVRNNYENHLVDETASLESLATL